MKKKDKALLLALAGIGIVIGTRIVMAHRDRYILRDRVAIITGGSRGLGLVLARHLAAKGVKVVICSRTLHQLQRAEDELTASGADVLAVECDVTDKAQVQQLIDATVTHFGRIDMVINNAGVIQVGPVSDMNVQEYEQAMKIHFWAPLFTTLAALPHFRARNEGRIVNVASIGGKIAVPHLLPYCASKFALVGLSEGLATELKKENILVTTVTPGLMRTGSPRNITVKGDHEKEYAWFKTSAAFSLISEHPEKVARKIVEALERNVTRPALSGIERLVSITKEIFPQAMELIMAKVNRLLPGDVADGYITKKGYDSESELSRNLIAEGADQDAKKNNEF